MSKPCQKKGPREPIQLKNKAKKLINKLKKIEAIILCTDCLGLDSTFKAIRLMIRLADLLLRIVMDCQNHYHDSIKFPHIFNAFYLKLSICSDLLNILQIIVIEVKQLLNLELSRSIKVNNFTLYRSLKKLIFELETIQGDIKEIRKLFASFIVSFIKMQFKNCTINI